MGKDVQARVPSCSKPPKNGRALKHAKACPFAQTSFGNVPISFMSGMGTFTSKRKKPFENQEKVIAVIVGWIKPWRLSYEAESAPCGVIAHELFGNAVTFKIFFPWLVGFGRRVNDAQY